jgi:hypothetical protein
MGKKKKEKKKKRVLPPLRLKVQLYPIIIIVTLNRRLLVLNMMSCPFRYSWTIDMKWAQHMGVERAVNGLEIWLDFGI